MEHLYSWLMVFSGATIALLGTFLFASERELRRSRREVDEFKRKHNTLPTEALTEVQHSEIHSSAHVVANHDELESRLHAITSQNEEIVEREAQLKTDLSQSQQRTENLMAKNKELMGEIGALSGKLAASEKRVEELDAGLLDNQRLVETNRQLQRNIAGFHEQLGTTQSQLAESAQRTQEVAERNEKLQIEVGELKQQLEQRQAAIDELQKESQKLRLENQGLHEDLENHRIRLDEGETRLQESVRRNQEVSNSCAALEAELGGFKRQLEDSQSKAREMESAQQQLVDVESREMIYREQQQKLEALIVDLERELSEGKNEVQSLEDTHERLRETDRVCQELANENRRLGEEIACWQERLAASEENQKQASLLRQQLEDLQLEHARLVARKGQAQLATSGEPIAVSARVLSDSNGAEAMQSTANTIAELSSHPGESSAASANDRMPAEITISEAKSLNNGSIGTAGEPQLSSGASAAAIPAEKQEDASGVVWTSVKRQWRVGVVAVIVVIIAGVVATGFLGTRSSTSKALAVATETRSDEYTASPVAKPQAKSAPRLRGTFETIRPTQVYGGPSENSELIANIGAGMKLNVVDSSKGWLEIRSKHGRPPGFIRQEAAVRIGQN
jgi:chromosome segregation ATPase